MRYVLAITLAAAASPATAGATDWYVYPGQSIQIAINSAQDGDRVLVQPGTYSGGLRYWGKAIEVLGVGGASVTTIDAYGTNYSGVTFVDGEGAGAVLDGFTIKGGNPINQQGGGIHCASASPTIRNCSIRVGNALIAGGGIYLYLGRSPI